MPHYRNWNSSYVHLRMYLLATFYLTPLSVHKKYSWSYLVEFDDFPIRNFITKQTAAHFL